MLGKTSLLLFSLCQKWPGLLSTVHGFDLSDVGGKYEIMGVLHLNSSSRKQLVLKVLLLVQIRYESIEKTLERSPTGESEICA